MGALPVRCIVAGQNGCAVTIEKWKVRSLEHRNDRMAAVESDAPACRRLHANEQWSEADTGRGDNLRVSNRTEAQDDEFDATRMHQAFCMSRLGCGGWESVL